MEPSFWGIIVFVVPALAIFFFLFKGNSHDEKVESHNMYKNYRKTRMDKPVL
jgi:hypothetical protein